MGQDDYLAMMREWISVRRILLQEQGNLQNPQNPIGRAARNLIENVVKN